MQNVYVCVCVCSPQSPSFLCYPFIRYPLDRTKILPPPYTWLNLPFKLDLSSQDGWNVHKIHALYKHVGFEFVHFLLLDVLLAWPCRSYSIVNLITLHMISIFNVNDNSSYDGDDINDNITTIQILNFGISWVHTFPTHNTIICIANWWTCSLNISNIQSHAFGKLLRFGGVHQPSNQRSHKMETCTEWKCVCFSSMNIYNGTMYGKRMAGKHADE